MHNDVLKQFAQKAKRRLVGQEKFLNPKIKVLSNDDADFKSKVEFLLSQEEVVTNPVQYLVDEKILKSLQGPAKERYLLSTLDKYITMKRQMENSNNYNQFCM